MRITCLRAVTHRLAKRLGERVFSGTRDKWSCPKVAIAKCVPELVDLIHSPASLPNIWINDLTFQKVMRN